MQGQILQVDTVARTGIVLGDDGNRYSFGAADWKAADMPAAGATVDFVPSEGRATEIFSLPGFGAAAQPRTVYVQPPPQAVAQNNSQLLGWLGVACLVLGFIIPILPTIAAFILGLIGADTAKRHRDSTGLVVSRLAWIGAVVVMVGGILLLAFAFTFAWPFLAAALDLVFEMSKEDFGQRV
jgi:hypothetical protein